MYTMEELRITSIVTAMISSADHVGSGRPAGSELEESDITDTKGVRDVVEESSDMEMVQQTHTTLMITSNGEKVWLEALIKEQDCCDRSYEASPRMAPGRSTGHHQCHPLLRGQALQSQTPQHLP